ncbi:MAG: hypothetical protein HPY45_11395 [Anaerolineae bacterium]|nr:hypothetical protein [Anaerolineae bacterium]
MRDHKKIVFAFTLLLFTLSLVCFGFVSLHTLMMADDYCYFGFLSRQNFFAAQLQSYTSATIYAGNRFAASLVSGLAGKIGNPVIPLFPIFTYLCLLTSFFFLFNQWSRSRGQNPNATHSALSSAVFFFFLLYLSPAHFQNRYWFSGIIAYTLPLAVFCTLLALLLAPAQKHRRSIARSAGIFTLSLLSAGFSETSAAAFLACLSLILLYMLIRCRKQISLDLLLAYVGMIIGTALMILSPSAYIRVDNLQPTGIEQTTQPLKLITRSLIFSFDFIYYTISGYILPLSIFTLTSAALGYVQSQGQTQPLSTSKLIFWGLSTIFSTFIIIAASMAPTIYAFSAYPNPRSQLICLFFLLAGIAVLMNLCGTYLTNHTRRIQPVALLLVLISGVYALRGGILELPYRYELQQRQQIWMERDAQIRNQINAGQTTVSARGIDRIETISDFNPPCFEQYYQINKIQLLD